MSESRRSVVETRVHDMPMPNVAESGPDVRIVVYMAREGLTLPRI
jgi:hypothetical protein